MFPICCFSHSRCRDIQSRLHSSSAMSSASGSTIMECEPFSCFTWQSSLATVMMQRLCCFTFSHHLCTSFPFWVQLLQTAFWGNSGERLTLTWQNKYSNFHHLRTILYLSCVYAIGSVLIAVGAIPVLHLPAQTFTVLGLLLIGLGSGGIKPCVSFVFRFIMFREHFFSSRLQLSAEINSRFRNKRSN